MDKFSYLNNLNPDSVDELYSQYLIDPDSVDETWKKFFEGFEFARSNFSKQKAEIVDKEFDVINLIEGYRKRGHLFTLTNPVRTRRKYSPTLDIENYGLSKTDLNTVFQAGTRIGIGPATLTDILDHLQTTYCRSVGAEYTYIRKPEVLDWLTTKMEKVRNLPSFSIEEKKDILFHLKLAVGFEKFIHKKFVGQKRFSLEGAESLIPALDAVIEKGSTLGVEEFIIGMAHRGRLNVLTNILHKPYEDIFNEYTGLMYDEDGITGDVKYHLGFDSDIISDKGKKVKLHLVPNPSHLETVGSLVQGISRAKIDIEYNKDENKLTPIVIHGDAAIAGQGIVYELSQMSQLEGYKTGGTIHLVINNQVGFTTSYLDARSSTYCTDVAKVTKSPVFHVNGDDVEALTYVIQLAMEYRQKFHGDVYIDILCYRKYGHNEGDEPRFTQPLLYKTIAKHQNARDIYAKKLIEEGAISLAEVEAYQKDFDELLDEKNQYAKQLDAVHIPRFMHEEWNGYRYSKDEDFEFSPKTAVAKKELLDISKKLNTLPEGQSFFKKIEKLLNDRNKMIDENRLDWASCELLAYGSLIKENKSVRLSGQDSERGTFSHRHAALTIEGTAEKYIPLKHVAENQAKFRVYNSLLSEYAVMGFEYGYALATPDDLTIWEAQFGDFHNTGQVIVDQYLSSAEHKWGLMNGLVFLLPHGYEGQGPEHSSARMERFLTLCANNNMQIVNCTTPANFFHVLRRQVTYSFRKPLVVFTPKSLLRHHLCVSPIEDLTGESRFKEVIDDNDVDLNLIDQVVFTSGKIYYDLETRKRELQVKGTAIVRIEQLHPFPKKQIDSIIEKYKKADRWLWVQDEPENMGAWSYISKQFKGLNIEPITRPASGSTAEGLFEIHIKRLNKIVSTVFRECTCENARRYCGSDCKRTVASFS